MRTVIYAEEISKRYELREHGTAYTLLREHLADLMRPRRAAAATSTFWALQNVGFSVEEGEVVGLIGRNGAGKSTLLKILSRITDPTSGRIDVYGRVGSLLEVGIGFHPELTGRDNIYLNGAILGMTLREVQRKFPEIVAFADIDQFIDTPVKRYSSGMYVRLAFAVAAHLEPDILIVDEVLGVGDAAFQKKCLGKMGEMRKQGRAVIAVSHNMAWISDICDRVLWLDAGTPRMTGPTHEVVHRYLSEGVHCRAVWTPPHPSLSEFEYHAISLRSGARDEPTDTISADTSLDIVVDFSVTRPLSQGRIELRVGDEFGDIILTTTSADPDGRRNHAWTLGRHEFRCHLPPSLLAPGIYKVAATHPFGGYDGVHEDVLSFQVTDQNSLASIDGRAGKIAPRLAWTRE